MGFRFGPQTRTCNGAAQEATTDVLGRHANVYSVQHLAEPEPDERRSCGEGSPMEQGDEASNLRLPTVSDATGRRAVFST